ncbi:hypothetical protein I4I73_11825 [Pseudonocardia sp. KRD-184]|uniref:EF-hand domain-containing protein n=1 Tax=Pseudonocardia oceani TaxID=2792013 RepID=A0ABS6U476_9PSEU|nr:hypothetical protein [Pseudonocardia oceani]MBW0094234.1 hypothetical protein [Pseudonocardia oceani]MBW0096675.1 hypothetical protein [Pseudonocardia oceani]MBW0121065.1 hypothetical protein [Pseudonocardia oceani]MBW0126964.1 hypothetical protein [Pseudonocardia oceani]
MSECYAPEMIDTTDVDTTDALELPATPEYSATDIAYEYVDLDGDGHTETTLIDSNDDGQIDAVLTDVDGDTYDDVAQFDNVPADGLFVADVVAIADHADGLADLVLDDTDLDGIFDVATPGGDEPLPYANPYETSAGVAPLGV